MKSILLSCCLQVSSKLQGFMEPQKNPFYKIDDKIRGFSKQLTDLHNKYEAVNIPGSHCILQVEQLLHLDRRVLFQSNLCTDYDAWSCVLYLHKLIFILWIFLLNLKTTDLERNLLLIRLIHRAVQCLFFNVVVHIFALPGHKWQSWDLIYCFLLPLLLVHWEGSVRTFIPNSHLFLQLDKLLRFKCDGAAAALLHMLSPFLGAEN